MRSLREIVERERESRDFEMPQLMERARECLESNCPKQALKILKKISTYETQDQRADVLYVFYKFLNFSTLSLSLSLNFFEMMMMRLNHCVYEISNFEQNLYSLSLSLIQKISNPNFYVLRFFYDLSNLYSLSLSHKV